MVFESYSVACYRLRYNESLFECREAACNADYVRVQKTFLHCLV